MAWDYAIGAVANLGSSIINSAYGNYWNNKYYKLSKDSLYNGYSIAASDMANAGLNPILASGSGSTSSGGSAQGSSVDAGGSAMLALAQSRHEASENAKNRDIEKYIADQQNNIAQQRVVNEQLNTEIKRSEEIYEEFVALSSNEREKEKHSQELEMLQKQIDESNERIKQLQAQTKDLEYEYEWKKSTGTSNNSSPAGRVAADAQKQVNNAVEGKPGVVQTGKNLLNGIKNWWSNITMSASSKKLLNAEAERNIQPPNPADYPTQKAFLDACAKVGLKNRNEMAVIWDDYQRNN